MEPLRTIVLILLAFIALPRSTSGDTITPAKPLTRNQTITSAGGNFALGFFTPGNSTHTYLGIWYNTIPTKTVIWVANRESPVPKNSSTAVVLTLWEDGNLVLQNKRKEVFWSTNVVGNSLSSGDSTVGVLLDTGNLILKHGAYGVKWQSFDYPTDTWMPEMKLSMNLTTGRGSHFTSWADDQDPRPGIYSVGMDPNGLQGYLWKGHEPYWRSDVFPAAATSASGYNSSQGFASYTTYVVDHAEMYYMFSPSLNSIKLRLTLVPSGKVEALLWEKNSWTKIFQFPAERCDFYGQCGPFAGCVKNVSLPLCNCLTGFEPKFQKDWSSGNWSGGCVRKKALSCDRGDRNAFLKHQRMKFPNNAVSLGNMTVDECQFRCIRNCSCTAYAYANLSGESQVRCLIWFGELVDLVYNRSTIDRGLYVRLHRSEIATDNVNGKSTHKDKRLIATAVSAVSVVLFLISIFGYKWRRKSKKNKESIHRISEVGNNDMELLTFSLRNVLTATDSFAEAKKLGEGGFGPVYKGSLQEYGEVAIKRLSKKSSQGLEEFMNELKLIAKLQHTNLVRLFGCCVEDDEKILIYEYMPNRSLEKILFDPSEQANLQWNQRFRIIEGIAQGLLYLHKYSRLRVIHRDLKASNILLDQAMTPKISDFGMARIFGMDQTEANTQRVVGTYGYMSPEYAIYGQFSEKSDVFSFGVLLLEIVSGKRNNGFHNKECPLTLLELTWETWIEGRGLKSIDPSIEETCNHHEAMKCINVGLLCVQGRPSERPPMSEVVLMLGNGSAVIPSPGEPAFTTRARSKEVTCSTSQTSSCYSNNEVTITSLDPR